MTRSIEFTNENILNIEELKMSTRIALKNIIEKEEFKTYKVSLNDISTNGGNYFGILQTVTVKGESENGKKELNLFLKNIVPVLDENFALDVAEMHKREGFFYRELVPMCERIQNKYKIPLEERFNTVKCYGVTDDGLIIMEDVAVAGYESFDRFKAVSLEFAEESIKQLARFHAMSHVIKKEHPKYYEEKIETLRTIFNFNSNFFSHMRRVFDLSMNSLDENAKIKLDNYFPKCVERYRKYIDVPVDEAVCLIHMDYRPNNILSKETEGEPPKIIPVDYQMMYFGCPVTDFLFFIFTGTDQEFRKNHLENMKDLYYSIFENFLSQFEIDAKEVYSRKQFDEEYREKLDYGLIGFLTLMPFIFAKADDIPELDAGFDNIQFHMDDSHKDRLCGIVDDFIKWGYL